MLKLNSGYSFKITDKRRFAHLIHTKSAVVVDKKNKSSDIMDLQFDENNDVDYEEITDEEFDRCEDEFFGSRFKRVLIKTWRFIR